VRDNSDTLGLMNLGNCDIFALLEQASCSSNVRRLAPIALVAAFSAICHCVLTASFLSLLFRWKVSLRTSIVP
jgi:hypothetical protein